MATVFHILFSALLVLLSFFIRLCAVVPVNSLTICESHFLILFCCCLNISCYLFAIFFFKTFFVGHTLYAMICYFNVCFSQQQKRVPLLYWVAIAMLEEKRRYFTKRSRDDFDKKWFPLRFFFSRFYFQVSDALFQSSAIEYS